jgi:hypothetical protein
MDVPKDTDVPHISRQPSICVHNGTNVGRIVRLLCRCVRMYPDVHQELPIWTGRPSSHRRCSYDETNLHNYVSVWTWMFIKQLCFQFRVGVCREEDVRT